MREEGRRAGLLEERTHWRWGEMRLEREVGPEGHIRVFDLHPKNDRKQLWEAT